MRHLRALLSASFLICCLLTVVATAQDQTLQIGNPLERQLKPGQAHTFTVNLEENTFIQLVVEQRGIDAVVKVSSPDGKSLGTFDTPNGADGPENVSFVAVTAGAYRVNVEPLNQEAAEGRYLIKIIEVREATEQEIKSGKTLETIKEKGIALVGEAENLMQEIRTPQTRIRSQLQAAQMLWELDEKRAAKFLNDAAAGLTELVATLDITDPDYVMGYSGITQLRYEIVQTLAGRDPDAAINFLQATRLPGTPHITEYDQNGQETALELMVADQNAATDPKRAFEMARRKLKTGYSPNLINTISAMRQKHPELATELVNEIVAKLLQEKLLKKPEAAGMSINLLISCQPKNSAGGFERRGNLAGAGLISDDLCRNLFQKALQDALSFSSPTPGAYTPEREAAFSLLNALQQLGPQLNEAVNGGLASVEKKIGELAIAPNPYLTTMNKVYGRMNSGGPVDEALALIEGAPENTREQLYIQLANSAAGRGDSAAARKIINEQITNPYQRRQALANLEQQETYQAISRGKVEEALRAISTMRTFRERANMLMQIARQIGPGHKRAAAMNLLEQARAMLAPGIHAQDQEQMSALLELARAFARYDARRAFEIVDPLVDQFNELCSAARTMEGFGLEYYKNDELEMINGNYLASLAANISSALATLAFTNFERAKTTSDRMRLPEARLRAYLEIAQHAIKGAK
jgi:hypothetical protein